MKLTIYTKRTLVLLIVTVIALMFVACSSPVVEEEEQTQITPVDYCTTADIDNMNFEYTSRDTSAKYDDNVVNVKLEGASATTDGEGVSVSSQKISIAKDGTYVFSGNYTDGQIYVSGDNIKAQIVLDNANINNSSGPAIYVEQANKVFVTLADDSENTLSDGLNYKDDLESYGVIFSKDDLCLNGSGKLTINANYKHAINCNDDLTITGGTYNINAAKDAIRANDSVKIKDGQFKITSGSDCITVNNKNAEDKGYLVIDGGTFDLSSVNEALKSCTYMRINDGQFNISAGDDALHNNVIIDINGGQLNIDAYDDAIHTESELNINDGNINITSCYEGLEAQMITVNGGDVSIVAADDSINASYAEWNTVSFEQQFENQGMQLETPQQQNKFDHRDMDMFYGDGGFGDQPGGVDPFSQGQMPQGQMPQGQDFGGGPVMNTGNGECKLTFNDGWVSADSQGDGIDSNGDIEINGGTLLINGPADGGNSPIDYGEQGSCTVNGGKVIAVGSVGMFENFTGGKQPFGFVRANGNAGSSVSVENSSGKEINSLTATKAFQVILVSDFEFSEGQTYNVRVGSQTYSLSVSTTAQNTSMFGGFGQMPGGFFGEGTEPPSPYGNGGMPLKF